MITNLLTVQAAPYLAVSSQLLWAHHLAQAEGPVPSVQPLLSCLATLGGAATMQSEGPTIVSPATLISF